MAKEGALVSIYNMVFC